MALPNATTNWFALVTRKTLLVELQWKLITLQEHHSSTLLLFWVRFVICISVSRFVDCCMSTCSYYIFGRDRVFLILAVTLISIFYVCPIRELVFFFRLFSFLVPFRTFSKCVFTVNRLSVDENRFRIVLLKLCWFCCYSAVFILVFSSHRQLHIFYVNNYINFTQYISME